MSCDLREAFRTPCDAARRGEDWGRAHQNLFHDCTMPLLKLRPWVGSSETVRTRFPPFVAAASAVVGSARSVRPKLPAIFTWVVPKRRRKEESVCFRIGI